ncbi:MAG: hypothetical protein HQK96_01475 [Nitrospirae bacterium]|nr:hypothetical protein [Nitrospirota bacterium]
MAWYKTGSDGLKDDIAKSQKARDGVKRLWLPPGGSKTIVFCDDTAFRFWEHNLKLDGSWRNWYVCLKKNLGEDCALCDNGSFNPYFVGFYTIIDKTGYTDRGGVAHKNEKLLFPAKALILEKMARHSEKRGGLTGCVFEVTRGTGKKSNSVGDDFDFQEKIDLVKDLPGIDTTPFKYDEIFKPETNALLGSLIEKSKENAEEAESVPY